MSSLSGQKLCPLYTSKVERGNRTLFCAKPGILALAEESRGILTLGRPFRGTRRVCMLLTRREMGGRRARPDLCPGQTNKKLHCYFLHYIISFFCSIVIHTHTVYFNVVIWSTTLILRPQEKNLKM